METVKELRDLINANGGDSSGVGTIAQGVRRFKESGGGSGGGGSLSVIKVASDCSQQIPVGLSGLSSDCTVELGATFGSFSVSDPNATIGSLVSNKRVVGFLAGNLRLADDSEGTNMTQEGVIDMTSPNSGYISNVIIESMTLAVFNSSSPVVTAVTPFIDSSDVVNSANTFVLSTRAQYWPMKQAQASATKGKYVFFDIYAIVEG